MATDEPATTAYPPTLPPTSPVSSSHCVFLDEGHAVSSSPGDAHRENADRDDHEDSRNESCSELSPAARTAPLFTEENGEEEEQDDGVLHVSTSSDPVWGSPGPGEFGRTRTVPYQRFQPGLGALDSESPTATTGDHVLSPSTADHVLSPSAVSDSFSNASYLTTPHNGLSLIIQDSMDGCRDSDSDGVLEEDEDNLAERQRQCQASFLMVSASAEEESTTDGDQLACGNRDPSFPCRQDGGCEKPANPGILSSCCG